MFQSDWHSESLWLHDGAKWITTERLIIEEQDESVSDDSNGEDVTSAKPSVNRYAELFKNTLMSIQKEDVNSVNLLNT